MTQGTKRVLVSAPGKVILFGEHAVVHQKVNDIIRNVKRNSLTRWQLAVAASLGLRTYLHLEENDTGKCRLNLPDVNIDVTWPLSELSLPVDKEALSKYITAHNKRIKTDDT